MLHGASGGILASAGAGVHSGKLNNRGLSYRFGASHCSAVASLKLEAPVVGLQVELSSSFFSPASPC